MLGLVGFGKIPKTLAQITTGLGVKVLAFDPYLTKKDIEDYGAQSVTFDELIRRSEIVSLHTPLSPETKNLIGFRQIEMMKDRVYIVNTSRGEIVDEAAILDGLKKRKIAGYACDVLTGEPPTSSQILKAAKDRLVDNVIITPHIAHATVEAFENCGALVVDQVKQILSKK